MALTLKTPRQEQLIVASVRKVLQTGDIEYLTKQAYDFIMLSSGFIAHYNLYGFMEEYRDVEKLRRELLANQRHNQWFNFNSSDKDYSYMMQKKHIYNNLCEVCKAR